MEGARVLTMALTTIELAEGETCLDRFYADKVRRKILRPAAALQIQNVHTRAAVLNEVDGWADVLGEPIESTPEGALFVVDWATTRFLRVNCPSTGQTYVLGVPAEMTTVKDARAWVNRGATSEDMRGMES